MNYLKIDSVDVANGPGLRTVLWVAGCTHDCPFCHNPETHDFLAGKPYNYGTRLNILKDLDHDYIEGLTLSGGDPLNPKNVEEISYLVKDFRDKFDHHKNIWCYTGYKFEQLIERCDEFTDNIIHNIDVLVDGRFIKSKYDSRLHWRGSSNQRLIDIPATFRENKIVISSETEKELKKLEIKSIIN